MGVVALAIKVCSSTISPRVFISMGRSAQMMRIPERPSCRALVRCDTMHLSPESATPQTQRIHSCAGFPRIWSPIWSPIWPAYQQRTALQRHYPRGIMFGPDGPGVAIQDGGCMNGSVCCLSSSWMVDEVRMPLWNQDASKAKGLPCFSSARSRKHLRRSRRAKERFQQPRLSPAGPIIAPTSDDVNSRKPDLDKTSFRAVSVPWSSLFGQLNSPRIMVPRALASPGFQDGFPASRA